VRGEVQGDRVEVVVTVQRLILFWFPQRSLEVKERFHLLGRRLRKRGLLYLESPSILRIPLQTKSAADMLHCPRCSGPLHVAAQQQQQPQQQCPAGHMCPFAAAGNTSSNEGGFTYSTSGAKAVNYLSGGSVFVPPSQHAAAERTVSAPAANPALSPIQQLDARIRALEDQRRGCPAAAAAAVFPLHQPQPFLLPTSHHHQHQGGFLQPQPGLAPLLITTTVGGLASAAPASVAFCQPATPAIVVGSTGAATPAVNPFFAASNLLSRPPPLQAPVNDHAVLTENMRKLEETCWFYGAMTFQESVDMLAASPAGTFIVRDSSDPRYLFAMSVQRGCGQYDGASDGGPTSVRIHYARGRFRLDADESIRDVMPSFPSVVELMEHYLAASAGREEEEAALRQKGKHVWVDNVGKMSSPIRLKQPRYHRPPSLAHSARMAVSAAVKASCGATSDPAPVLAAADGLGLPSKLAAFLRQYPHSV